MKEQKLGSLWQSATVEQSLEKGQICSTGGGSSVRLCVRNHLDDPIVFCWVDESSKLCHFRLVDPCSVPYEHKISKDDFIERTSTGHAFVFATGSKEACLEANRTKSLAGIDLLGAYRLDTADEKMHLLSIVTEDEDEDIQTSILCCIGGLRRKKRRASERDQSAILKVGPGVIDSKPIDTTNKKYVSSTLGGWPVHLETNWHGGDKEVEERLKRDINYATSCLPPHAYEALKEKTPIWINRSLEYGPEACPTRGIGLCFHPAEDWLIENGCHKQKCHSVELYCSKEYKNTAPHWGTGGVILHELSHAYHCLCLDDGYENAEIKACFEAAMRDKLYEKVKVHGSQGPEARAYACTDQMEYWAELSAAFLGSTDTSEEYNKWFPFNRPQIKTHDPRAYELLKCLWKVDE